MLYKLAPTAAKLTVLSVLFLFRLRREGKLFLVSQYTLRIMAVTLFFEEFVPNEIQGIQIKHVGGTTI